MSADLIVIGGGIVGLSTAMQLAARLPHFRIVLVEKETAVAAHQTGHNSGVIHAGVYYAPGSLKARFCREGSAATYAFCRDHGLPAERCGKLIVAGTGAESDRLKVLYSRCRQSGLNPTWLDARRLGEIEPRIVGREALLVEASGITDYPAIARTMGHLFEKAGGRILLQHRVTGIREAADGIVVETERGALRARYAVACGGLMADRLARMCGLEPDFHILPFRGEYFRLPDSKNDIVKHLIYPVPDPSLPFLGVHLTRMIGGYVNVGPNAVLAMAREGYRWRDLSLRDIALMAGFPGTRRLLARHARFVAREFVNSVSRRAYLRECRRYCPELRLEDLQPEPAGVRAQAVRADGTLIDDFLVLRGRRSLHVCNAPSPAATAALPIGRYLVEQCIAAFDIDAERGGRSERDGPPDHRGVIDRIVSSSARPATPDEAGFCPVINRPSVTTWGSQSGALE
jgi:L-2-hydroxyglutarate oxidase